MVITKGSIAGEGGSARVSTPNLAHTSCHAGCCPENLNSDATRPGGWGGTLLTTHQR